MKGVGMLVVSLRGVNFGFWSHLGCFGQKAIIFRRKGLVLTWSLLGVKKSLGHAQIGLLQGQTLCDKRDNNFVLISLLPNFTFL